MHTVQSREGISATDAKRENNRDAYQTKTQQVIQTFIPQLHSILRPIVTFHLTYLAIAALEILSLLTFFSFFTQTTFFAFFLALIFLTIFSFFILRIYLQTKKPEQLKVLMQQYLQACKNLISYKDNTTQHNILIADACCRCAAAIHEGQSSIISLPFQLRWLSAFMPVINGLCRWWLWNDYHSMKEMLLQTSVNEHIKMVKQEPTNLEMHAALANAYITMSAIYVDPKKLEGLEQEKIMPPRQYIELLEQKYRLTVQYALEEFKILSEYAPNDPWVHAQLAYSYHDLMMPEKEIEEYEIILNLCPGDVDTLFKLGILYFHQGYNAKGLRVYRELRKSHYDKAEELIKYYGSYQNKESSLV